MFSHEQYEFQCLHGMGEPLYEQVIATRPCRVYAPVGMHETLLAYLVRRLLENGANTSFVNRIADATMPLEALVEDPVRTVEAIAAREGGVVGAPHPAIALPREILAGRRNSRGLDLADERTLVTLARAFADDAARAGDKAWRAEPLIARGSPSVPWQPVRNPANAQDIVGQVQEATDADVRAALTAATLPASSWSSVSPHERASRLESAAQRLEDDTLVLIPLLVREAGKTCANAVAEVREAVDFLRYYAGEIRRDFDNATHVPLGPVVAISPWNFPLAIFVGQIAAALAAGNVVLAKPAEQTPLVAAAAVRALHASGIPAGALQLLPGRGETVGSALVGDARVHGVLFTGSTDVARILQRTLAGRLTDRGQVEPLIAETGGQNARVVDSSALVEQGVGDIVSSAFDSAGQRCSALRLLCVQDDAADRLLPMLRGAVQELRVGDPWVLATDVGPVIDADAAASIEDHVQAMAARGRKVWRLPVDAEVAARGTFVAPAVIELDDIAELEREVFGPVLHVLRFRREDLPRTLERINATGYGLTHGVHTRIDETVAQVVGAWKAGNIYVNRNIVGAVVGVQPFGGEGLSGTGPKAGGPLYLLRLLAERPVQAARLAVTNSGTGLGSSQRAPVRGLADAARPDEDKGDPVEALQALRAWALAQGRTKLTAVCDRAVAESPVGSWQSLPGPTGEANLYAVVPREAVLCLAPDGAAGDDDRLAQLAAVLAVGSHAVSRCGPRTLERCSIACRPTCASTSRWRRTGDWTRAEVRIDAAVQHGDAAALIATAQALATQPGPIVALTGMEPGDTAVPLERLVAERSLSVNTAAAGGNASLMTLG